MMSANPVHARLARLRQAFAPQRPKAPAFHGQERALAAVAGLSLATTLTALAAAAMLGALVDAAAFGGDAGPLMAVSVGAMLLFELLARRSRGRILREAANAAHAAAGQAVFRRILAGDVQGGAGRVSSLLQGYRAVRAAAAIAPTPAVCAALDGLGVPLLIAACAIFAGPLALAPGALALVYAVIVVRAALAPQGASAERRLQAAMYEAVGKRAALEELGAERMWAERLAKLAVRADRAAARAEAHDALRRTAMQILAGLGLCAALALGAFGLMDGAATFGGVAAALALTARVAWIGERLSGHMPRLRRAAATLRDALDAARAPAPVRTGVREADGPMALAVRGATLKRDGLTILRSISFDVAPGEIVGLCGPSGSGRSILLAAIAGLRPLTDGAVQFDGRDRAAYDPASLAAAIGYLPQRLMLFQGSVGDMMRLIAPGADDGALEAALAHAGLPITALSDGLDTALAASGRTDANLSTKIMLAALYAKRPKLLLLDEPGALLDRNGDMALLRQLDRLRGRAGVLIATNRPSHLRRCDRIIRLDHGALVIDGPVGRVLSA